MATYDNTIQAFKAGFNGGTRSNRFEVRSDLDSWPTGVLIAPEETKFKVFASSLPKAEVGTIPVPYRGRLLLLAGDRTYSFWTLQVYDDNGNRTLWKAFHKWKELMDGYSSHLVTNNDFAFKNLQKTWKINQLGLNGDVLRTITLFNCWPSTVGSIDLNMSKADQVVFSVQMTFDYYEISKGLEGV